MKNGNEQVSERIILGPNRSFGESSFRMAPSTFAALKAAIERDPAVAHVLARLLRKYLDRLQSPPGSGYFDPVTVIEEVQMVGCEMSMLGLWNKVPIERFKRELDFPLTDDFKKYFFGECK